MLEHCSVGCTVLKPFQFLGDVFELSQHLFDRSQEHTDLSHILNLANLLTSLHFKLKFLSFREAVAIE